MSYYGKQLSKAKMAMESAIWKHGAKKRDLTNAIILLKKIDLKDHPDIKKAIDVLTVERKRLDKVQLF